MAKGFRHRSRWGVILAGGDGTRLKPLTRFIEGDDRPKQFCRLFDGQTLLAQTRSRISPSVLDEQTLFILTQAHERFFHQELAAVAAERMVVQPDNRGTLPAILCSLLQVARVSPNATVAFFPSDHHYTDEKRMMAGVESAFRSADRNPEIVILLGASAQHPEVSYGWIEPVRDAEGAGCGESRNLAPVARFWEKPSSAEALHLWKRGCLWNTFVMIGKVSAYLEMIRSAAPDVYRAFDEALMGSADGVSAEFLASLYTRIESSDFSRQVLSAATGRLRVLPLGEVGWSDLGEPQRVLSTASRYGAKSAWVGSFERAFAASAS